MARVETVRKNLLASRNAESVLATERGTQGGFGHWGESRSQRRASSFSASPTANPVGVRKSMDRRLPTIFLRAGLACAAFALLVPSGAAAQSTGGATYVPPPPPAKRAKIVDGVAIPPAGAPVRVKHAIAAANRIIRKPYLYGGGHSPYAGSWSRTPLDRGYDCSGTISFALWGGKYLSSPLNSSGFMSWGQPGRGRWITVYANPGHAYVVIAGLRLDTSVGERASVEDRRSGRGPRWRLYSRSPAGFTARHPAGF